MVAGESEKFDISGPTISLTTVGVTVIEPLKLIEVVALTAGFVSSAGILLLTSAVQEYSCGVSSSIVPPIIS